MNQRSETIVEAQAGPLDGIDTAALTPLVQRALGRPTVQVTEWDVQQIHGGVGGGVFASNVYRLSGQGRDQGQTVPWSLILKTFSPAADATPDSPYYPRREAQAYHSGWLDDLPGGLAAPVCYGVVEHPDGGIWVWLEEVIDELGSDWPLARYGLAARHLGQFNGAYLMDPSPPTWPWFSKNFLRRSVAITAPAITQLSEEIDNPEVRCWYPSDISNRCLRLWDERECLLDALDRLPRTICHMDAFPRNLFSQQNANGDQTVAIDWAFVGLGAVGEEIEPLICRSADFDHVEPAQAGELDEIVFTGYLDGLHDAGWQDDPRQVRLGYTAAVTLRYLVGISQILPLLLDGSIHYLIPQLFGRSADEMADRNVACQRFKFGLAKEALELLDTLQ